MLFTTNKDPKRWGTVLHDDDLGEAIVDRILDRGRLLRLDGPSLRTKHLPDDELVGDDQPLPESAKVSGKQGTEFPEPTGRSLRARAVTSRLSSPNRAGSILAMQPSHEPVRTVGEGTVLAERYRLVRMIGAGAMGEVWEADHIALGQRVAIKCILPEHAREAEFVVRFAHEARVLAKLAHPRILAVRDLDQLADGTVFVVMDLLRGRDLGWEMTVAGRLPPARAFLIAAQVAEALSAAHAENIVHRDVKPANVFLVGEAGAADDARLVDFGIAKLLGGAYVPTILRTKPGEVVGTISYMAPELLLEDGAPDCRADLWSLGVMLFEMLTGACPFDGKTFYATVDNVTRRPLPSLASYIPDLPPRASAEIGRLCNKDREQRPASAEDARRSLLEVAEWIHRPRASSGE